MLVELAVHRGRLPLQVQSWRVATSKVGKPTQTKPRPQTCFDEPQAALVQGPANCAVAATAKVKRVAMSEVCILDVVELKQLVMIMLKGKLKRARADKLDIQIERYAIEAESWFPSGTFILYTKCSYNILANVRHRWCGSGSAHSSLDSKVYSWCFMRVAATYK